MEVRGMASSRPATKWVNPMQEIAPIHQDQSEKEDKLTVEQSQELIKDSIKEKVQGLNDFLAPIHTTIKFTFHEKLQEYYVQVIDESTDEVIREIPPKKFLDMYASMVEFMGLFVDEKR